jgi:hypothetical protein
MVVAINFWPLEVEEVPRAVMVCWKGKDGRERRSVAKCVDTQPVPGDILTRSLVNGNLERRGAGDT